MGHVRNAVSDFTVHLDLQQLLRLKVRYRRHRLTSLMSSWSRTWSECVEASDPDDVFRVCVDNDEVQATPSGIQITSHYAANTSELLLLRSYHRRSAVAQHWVTAIHLTSSQWESGEFWPSTKSKPLHRLPKIWRSRLWLQDDPHTKLVNIHSRKFLGKLAKCNVFYLFSLHFYFFIFLRFPHKLDL